MLQKFTLVLISIILPIIDPILPSLKCIHLYCMWNIFQNHEQYVEKKTRQILWLAYYSTSHGRWNLALCSAYIYIFNIAGSINIIFSGYKNPSHSKRRTWTVWGAGQWNLWNSLQVNRNVTVLKRLSHEIFRVFFLPS